MLRKGQKAMLQILKRRGRTSKIKMMKLLFLMDNEFRPYDFIPYHYGPFSFQMYHEMGNLEDNDIISTSKKDIWINQGNMNFEIKEDRFLSEVNRCLEQYGDMSDSELLDYIYDKYPEYSIFSQISKRMNYERNEKGITTIGYEGRSIDEFLKLFIDNKINVLIDVRKNAFSMKFGFSKNRLRSYCEKLGMDYIHIPELGIESESRKELNTFGDYQVLFEKYDKTLPDRKEYIERIINISRNSKVAMMCFEKDIEYCHRNRIANWIRDKGLEVMDI